MNNWLGRFSEKFQPWAWLALRVILGAFFAMHGAQKLFGFMGATPQAFLGGMGFFGINLGVNMLWIAGLVEFGTGILIAVGLFTRWAAALAAIQMILAYAAAHLGWNPLATGGELAAIYFFVWINVFAYGPGRYSIDGMLSREKASA